MSILKGKKLVERLELFKSWQLSFEENLKPVLSLSSNLDFSPASLMILERIILSLYDNPKMIYLLENKNLLDSISLYIGEVYRRNISNNIVWGVNLDKTDEDIGMYNFPFYLKSYNSFLGFNPFSQIPFAVNKRWGNILFTHFEHNAKLFSENDKQNVDELLILPINGFAYQAYLLYKNDAVSLNDIEKTLADYASKKNASFQYYGDNHLVLSFNMGYNFHFDLDKRPEVIEESKELSQSLKIPDVALCNSRIEFWGDEDPDLDFMNESLFILERLNPLPIIIYDFNTGILFNNG